MRLLIKILLGLLVTTASFADKNLGLPPLSIPTDNPQTTEKVKLGQLLFNDKRLSADGSISCASCHRADTAFTDGLPVSKGIKQQLGTRNAPTVINSAYYETQFLDGRESSLEAQAKGPLVNPVEHGFTHLQQVVDVVKQDAAYREQFQQVFNVLPDSITIEHIAKAIASFERTLITGDSAFDRYYFGKDQSALSDSAARGSRIFRRKGNCMTCHEISWNNALFTDNRFYNVGIGFERLKPVLTELTSAINQQKEVDITGLTDAQRSELGRFAVTRIPADLGRFKTPTLRNVAVTAPYMHDGSLKTLEEVIEHYDKGGISNAYIDPKIFPLHLTVQEKADLVAFLKSLTSPENELN
ncbi:MAG: cytochrome c peroxidase [Methylicorpusculum sp.]|uniref:cytochrome-c peroxidase n=1 Tax=Methylicorpusculum sp. TaxID=2713644 RepID=UPI002726CBB8|nr:cytochrome c peroxidase [Methylicorpusculum sp.]MDO8940002.1 cytochrome c peroxidase [Methylicorpusculum sp.]MDP2203130.1 cytochrome c peroxidase [Methylicorpusculum sp.]